MATEPIAGRAILRHFTNARGAVALLAGMAIFLLHLMTRSDLLALAIVVPVLVLLVPWPASIDSTPPPLTGRLPDADALGAYLDRRVSTGEEFLPALICLSPLPENGVCAQPSRDDLITAAAAIRTVLRPEDLIGTDTDGALYVALCNRSDAAIENLIQVSMRLQKRLQNPCASKEGTLSFSTAIGICAAALHPSGEGARAAMTAAKSALELARAKGPGAIHIAEGEKNEINSLGVELALELDSALSNGQITAFFQPQVCTDTGALTGVEALARWQHPVHGMLAPGQFLPTIEAAGAEPALTNTIVAHALQSLTLWDAQQLDVPYVSINLTYADLNDPDLASRLADLIDGAGLTPDRLGIEVLETVLSLSASDVVPHTLSALRTMGCKIDLDDFGTGQASIASIRRFSIDRLKIDRSFVRDLDRDPEQQSMVAAIVTMAEQLKIEVLAEGVETPEQHARAAQLGCGYVQGFGIGRPMDASALPRWHATRQNDLAIGAMPKVLRDLANRPMPPNRARLSSAARRGKTA